MPKPPADPNRARLADLLEQTSDRLSNLRDYASAPGNSWLAKGELGSISQLISEIEDVLEAIKTADAEDGY